MCEIPNKDNVVRKIHESFDSTEYIKGIYKSIKNNIWEEALYKYFSEVYEELFANLMLKKTFVSNDTKKMLELLATPIYRKTEEEKDEIYSKIEKV